MLKEMTLDNLAVMIQGEFASLRENITSIEERMATKDDIKDLDIKLSGRIESLDLKLSAHIGQTERLEGRVDQAESDIIALYKLVPAKR